MPVTFTVEIIKIGDELGFILPEELISRLGLGVGDELTFTLAKNASSIDRK